MTCLLHNTGISSEQTYLKQGQQSSSHDSHVSVMWLCTCQAVMSSLNVSYCVQWLTQIIILIVCNLLFELFDFVFTCIMCIFMISILITCLMIKLFSFNFFFVIFTGTIFVMPQI